MVLHQDQLHKMTPTLLGGAAGRSSLQRCIGTTLSSCCVVDAAEQKVTRDGKIAQTILTSLAGRKRRRVRFCADGDDDDLKVERVVHEIDSRESLSKKLKSELWVQRQDLELSVSNIRRQFHQNDSKSGREFPLYGEALCVAYVACCEDSSDQEGRVPSGLSPGLLELLGTERGESRGLESCAIPSLAVVRNQKRRESVRNVVALHKLLRGIPDELDLIRLVAEDMSRPARKFAHAMGIGDAVAGFQAYLL
ncbi:hypothetical protein ACA910_011045 [Epithemia clementina (nom. ined.)]